MKPLRQRHLVDATPLDGRGRRTPQTLLTLDERDHYLRDAANKVAELRTLSPKGIDRVGDENANA